MPNPEVRAPLPSYGPSVMEASATDRLSSVLAQPEPGRLRAISRRVWVGLAAAWAALTGLLPHVLHHVGPLAGAALFAGVGGSLLFFAIGLVAAIPFLRRLHRRFGSWRAPALAVGVFAVVFSFSTFVIGPKISGTGEGGGTSSATSQSQQAAPAPAPQVDEHGH